MPSFLTIILGAVILAGLAFLWFWLTQKNKATKAGQSTSCSGNCAACADKCANRK